MKATGFTILCFALVASFLQAFAADSCSGRCGSKSNSFDCQCNTYCEQYQDCCSDYFINCKGASSISRSELNSLATNLWNNDVNRLSSSYYTIDKQTKLTNHRAEVDMSSRNFFSSVNTNRLGGTWPSYQNLLNNYIIKTGTKETVTDAEINEMNSFLDKIMATNVMDITYDLLNSKGYFSSWSAFRNYVEGLWFNLYSRSSGKLDSSGFEHVFVGEIKNNAVSGFHNWLQFYLLEQSGRLNYFGYVEEANPDLILFQFSVDGYVKTLSSIMYGVSPEFELALFTTCFVSKPNSMCSFTLQGSTVSIQTYDYSGGYVGSAYFSV